MVKLGYNVSAIRIQRDVCFTSGNMLWKHNRRNSWNEVSYETIPKPKISELNGVKGQLILGVIFSLLAIIVTDTAFAF